MLTLLLDVFDVPLPIDLCHRVTLKNVFHVFKAHL